MYHSGQATDQTLWVWACFVPLSKKKKKKKPDQLFPEFLQHYIRVISPNPLKNLIYLGSELAAVIVPVGAVVGVRFSW